LHIAKYRRYEVKSIAAYKLLVFLKI